MNKEVTILQGQSLIDISVQYTGIAENVYAIAKTNGISLHQALHLLSVVIPKTEKYKQAVNYFTIQNTSKPATYGQYTPSLNYIDEYVSSISNYQIPEVRKTITVLNGQSLFDFSIEHLGSAIFAYELAKVNGKSVSEMLTVGEVLQLPKVAISKDIVTFFTISANKPATAGIYTEVSQGDYYYEEYDNQEYSI